MNKKRSLGADPVEQLSSNTTTFATFQRNKKTMSTTTNALVPVRSIGTQDGTTAPAASTCSNSSGAHNHHHHHHNHTVPKDVNNLAIEQQDGNSASHEVSLGLIFESGDGHYDRKNRLQRERPLRIVTVEAALRNVGLLSRCKIYQTKEDILSAHDYHAVHLPAYLERLDKVSACYSDDRLDQEAAQYDSIFLTSDSFLECKRAVNALCTLTDHVIAVASGMSSFGFAVIRPPGHHAEPHQMGGYCILNNVATAVQYARLRHSVGKILIIDWDVHHGNGTQKVFEKNRNVLYFSIHRGRIYPYSGHASEVGQDEGKGYTVNVAWNSKGMGDEEYIAAFQQILLPIMTQFEPEMVFISAGFDAAIGDLGECCVTPQGFACLTRMIRHQLLWSHRRSNIPLICSLEGGYVRSMLAKCVVAVAEVLLEEDETVLQHPLPSHPIHIHPQAQLDIENTIRHHESYWKLRHTRNTK